MAKQSNREIIENANQQLGKLFEARPDLKEAFYDTLLPEVMKEGSALDVKYKELVALGIAIHAECESCIALHVQSALENSATRDEILDVCAVSVLMGGGPGLMFALKAQEALDEMAPED